MTVRIRLANAGDAVGIAKVHVNGWRSTYPGIIPDHCLTGLSEETSTVQWQKALQQAARYSRTLVADCSEEGIVGFTSGGAPRAPLSGYSAEVYALYLLDSYHGQGLGRRLLTSLARELVDINMNSLAAWVLRHNPNRWFFAYMGGIPIGESNSRVGAFALDEIGYGWPDTHMLTCQVPSTVRLRRRR